jgi:16S rRNA (guanine966-N2)-methyltransferase
MIKIVAGKYRSRSIEVPPSLEVPTKGIVRTAISNALMNDIPSTRVLDLFAGSGALGLEALSRGAEEAVFVDSSSEAVETIQKNLQNLHESQGEVILGDALKVLERLAMEKRVFDIVFLDPPYKEKELYPECEAFLLKKGLLSEKGILVFEFEGEISISEEGFPFAKTYNYGRTNVRILRK